MIKTVCLCRRKKIKLLNRYCARSLPTDKKQDECLFGSGILYIFNMLLVIKSDVG